MSRPLKDGVDYFPKDTEYYNDDKVRLLRAEFGAKGMYLLDYILCDLYGKNGYFSKWGDNKCFLVSDGAGCGCSPSFVSEFIVGCIRHSFFDERVFNMFGVLTSAGIQRRFVRMLKSRENFTFIEEYFLLDMSDIKDVPKAILDKITFKKVLGTENPDKRTENPFRSSDNSQSKIKESKVEESKVNNTKTTSAVGSSIFKLFEENIGLLSQYKANVLNDHIEKFGEELVYLAIENAIKSNKNSLKYIEGILNNWEKSGIKTVEAAKDEMIRFKQTSNIIPGSGIQKAKTNAFNNYSSEYGQTDVEKELFNKRMAKLEETK